MSTVSLRWKYNITVCNWTPLLYSRFSNSLNFVFEIGYGGSIYTMDTGKCYKWDIFVESQVVKYLSAIIATTRLTYKNFKRLAISCGPGHVGKKIRVEKNLQGLSNPHKSWVTCEFHDFTLHFSPWFLILESRA